MARVDLMHAIPLGLGIEGPVSWEIPASSTGGSQASYTHVIVASRGHDDPACEDGAPEDGRKAGTVLRTWKP